MSKNVKWTVPFQSIKGLKYRVNIYEEGYAGEPITLLGAEDVFSTEENASNDVFAPSRAQTAVLRVVDNGSLLSEEIIPQDNVSRPVELVDESGNILWLGFVACDSFTQSYTDIANVIDINCNSLLEAADSVELEIDTKMMFNTILSHISYALYTLGKKGGITDKFGYLCIDARYYQAIVEKKIYNNSYFTAEEMINGDNISFEVHSSSVKKLFENIAGFFGCSWREHNNNLYMVDNIPAPSKVSSDPSARPCFVIDINNLINSLYLNTDTIHVQPKILNRTMDMADFEYRGAEHNKTVSQGARRVQVLSSLKKFEGKLSLPECPYGSLVTPPNYEDLHVNTNDEFYSLSSYKYIHGSVGCPGSSAGGFTYYFNNYIDTLPYQLSSYWHINEFRQYYYDLVLTLTKRGQPDVWMMAYYAIWRLNETPVSGLMVCGLPKYLRVGDQQYRQITRFPLTEANALYTQTTALPFAASSGWLNINSIVSVFNCINGQGAGGTEKPALTISVQFGDKYWNGTAWQDSWTTFELGLETDGTTTKNKTEEMDTLEEDGYFIPISELMVGFVTVKIYHEIKGWHFDILRQVWDPAFDVFITKFDVAYVAPNRDFLADRTQNSYFKYTGRNFADVVSTNVQFATDAANDISATMLWDSDKVPTKKLVFDGVSVRPEVDLLERMNKYYKDARREIVLQVDKQRGNEPIISVNGYDGKKYMPLAESRDWATDTSSITLFETPNNE